MKAKTVAILESRLGSQLAELISKRGGQPLLAPALAEVPDADRDYIAGFVAGLGLAPAKVAIFQTGVGTQALFSTTDALGLSETLLGLLAAAVVVARGPKPTSALRSRGVRIDVSAKEPFTTAELIAALQQVPIDGERVIVQRYGETNTKLQQALHARGAEAIEIPTYRWALPEDTKPLVRLMDALDRREIDAAVFTSAAQVRNLFALAVNLGRKDSLAAALNATPVVSIGPVCTAALTTLGIRVTLEASPPKLGPLLSALDELLSR